MRVAVGADAGLSHFRNICRLSSEPVKLPLTKRRLWQWGHSRWLKGSSARRLISRSAPTRRPLSVGVQAMQGSPRRARFSRPLSQCRWPASSVRQGQDLFAEPNLDTSSVKQIVQLFGGPLPVVPSVAEEAISQLQASSSLFFEVFQKYDPGNRLLAQAEQELLSQELDVQQLSAVMARMQSQTLKQVALNKPSPLAFPLMVERLRERLSNESLADRIARMVADLEGGA